MTSLTRGLWHEHDPHEIELRDLLDVPGSPSRTQIALALWMITATFVGDHEPLDVPDGTSIAEAAEAFVREHADDALGSQLTQDALGAYAGALVIPVLHGLALTDDFSRAQRHEQHMAFEPAHLPGVDITESVVR
ncbi:hypothetical protein [Nocardioides sp. InS609-2]|uniref:hypothetical protein n=1 Tax=Nocardioides sp. InS609-2 TaxID=2760705 RepID=UPI0020BEEF97|nr:hypothetical protein [Nocardioides sp. InS609-2]